MDGGESWQEAGKDRKKSRLKVVWVVAAVLGIGFLFLLFSGAKIVVADCEDGGPPVFGGRENCNLWCSALNARVNNVNDCPPSECPDGEKMFNLHYCEKYECADGSEVASPEECIKFVCLDGSRIEDPKKCQEYCESADECDSGKAEVKECFGKWACVQNECVWQCDIGGGYASRSPKEIAVSLDEAVQDGYSQIGSAQETENNGIIAYSSAFENGRGKIIFAQTVMSLEGGYEKTQLANTFNMGVNEFTKKGYDEWRTFQFGEDSFATKIPTSETPGKIVPVSGLEVNLDYENVYFLMFRKMNNTVTLMVNTDSDEKAAEFFNNYGKKLELRII